MKKLLLILLGTLMTFATASSQATLMLQGGTNFSGITGNENYDARFGYRVGASINYPIGETWGIMGGVHFLNRSFSFDAIEYISNNPPGGSYTLNAVEYKSKVNALYLQMPIKATFTTSIGDDIDLQLNFGPYVAVGVGGHRQYQYTHSSKKVFVNGQGIEQGGDFIIHAQKGKQRRGAFEEGEDGTIRRVDMGLSLGANVFYGSFFAGISGEIGLTPMERNIPRNFINSILYSEYAKVSCRNIALEIHVGYSFQL